MPDIEAPGQRKAITLRGEMPNPDAPPAGCAFHPRCHAVQERCRSLAPPAKDIGAPGRPHLVRCWLDASAGTSLSGA